LALDTIRLYLDENLSPVIAQQLRRRGIEVFTTQELGTLSDEDINHLQRATEMGCVLCTHDDDFLRLASEGIEHAGIAFGDQNRHDIGDWVKTRLRYSIGLVQSR
jgi:predicted nuclease of predicted toxin-antitoxin system